MLVYVGQKLDGGASFDGYNPGPGRFRGYEGSRYGEDYDRERDDCQPQYDNQAILAQQQYNSALVVQRNVYERALIA